jgi:hypothetical protein
MLLAHVVEHLPSKNEVLNWNPLPPKRREKKLMSLSMVLPVLIPAT